MIINRLAKSSLVQRFISKTQNKPEFYKKVNNSLPILETSVATLCYSIAIQNNSKIEKDRKPALHYQNWICGGAGILFGSAINKFINKYKNEICTNLEKNGKNIDKLHNVIKGVQVALPLIIFSTLLRYIIPVISTPISTYLERGRKHVLTKTNKDDSINKNIINNNK